jgi:hypothetical protein
LELSGSVLDGAVVKTLSSSDYDNETGTLTLNFTDNLREIEAGKPYIVKWDGDGVPSAISTLRADTAIAADGIYTLDGRRLTGKPTAKGLYIVNGKKMIIK